MSRIVMIGGHGKVALLAAPLLVEAGHEVISLIRNPDQADDVAAGIRPPPDEPGAGPRDRRVAAEIVG